MKFPIFTKNNTGDSSGDFSFLGTDLHSHLIPGIDDGSPDMETSVSLITSLHEMGYSRIITTPHIKQGYYPNDASTILPGCESVRQELKLRDIPVDLTAAAEYFLDADLIELMRNDEPLLTLTGKKLLVEISFIAPPLQLHEFLYQLQMKGYEPIIAHPERYGYYHREPEQYQKLIDVGCELQLNLLSLTGHYGKEVKKAAFKLLQKQSVSYLGTDLHHYRHIEGLDGILRNRGLMQTLRDYPWKNTDL
ncbi:MAG TPA: CpsB/CapC family capsule biosynthesis tyrosine phosphatase [Chitinophagaceae bacterium]|nr:CpsB/CapC family capsule biosynthesis tyrosine phosphatase [Chitinophagaceae bacterium]